MTITINGIKYTFSRGFVDSVETTCDKFLRHGPAIVREHPVTRVVLVGKRPELGGNGWVLRCAGDMDDPPRTTFNGPNLIPWAIYWKMPGSLGAYMAEFDSEAIALQNMSAGCLAWAKSAELVSA